MSGKTKIRIDPPLADVLIVLESLETGKIITAKTDNEGKALMRVWAGRYKIYAIKEGFEPYVAEIDVTGDMILNITMTPTAPANASGLDPNDPEWMPEDGWTTVWEFKDPAELDDFANSIKEDAYVENDVVKFNPQEDDRACIERYVDSIYKKVAICLKVNVIFTVGSYSIIEGTIQDGTYLHSILLTTIADDVTKLRLVDWGSATSIVFDNPSDWMIVIIDYVNEIAKVYDKNKNVIAELNITPESYTTTGSRIQVCEENHTNFIVNDVEVDWIAVKE